MTTEKAHKDQPTVLMEADAENNQWTLATLEGAKFGTVGWEDGILKMNPGGVFPPLGPCKVVYYLPPLPRKLRTSALGITREWGECLQYSYTDLELKACSTPPGGMELEVCILQDPTAVQEDWAAFLTDLALELEVFRYNMVRVAECRHEVFESEYNRIVEFLQASIKFYDTRLDELHEQIESTKAHAVNNPSVLMGVDLRNYADKMSKLEKEYESDRSARQAMSEALKIIQ